MSDEQKNIIILGGGFGGLRVALDLERQRRSLDGYQIILIDHATSHLYTPLLYEVASAFLYSVPVKERYCMQTGVCVDFTTAGLARQLRDARVIHGTVVGIDPKQQLVEVEDHPPIPYEYCVVALGSVVEDFGIEGIAEHGAFFKTMHDAMRIHERIYELIRRKQSGKEKKITIVIGGGGPAGVELAGELVGFCQHACRDFGLAAQDFSITLVEASNRLLGALDPTLGRWALDRLERLGVDVHLDTCVKQVKKNSALIAPRPLREGESSDVLLCDFRHEKEREIEADLFVWSGGVRASEVVKQMPFLHDTRGRLDVESTMKVKGEERVFAIGDAAALVDPKTNRVVPALAQTAIFQGRLAAQNIANEIRKDPHVHYTFPFLAYLVPLGGKYALAQFGHVKLRGHLLYFLHRLIDLKYFLSILPFTAALVTWWRGWKIYGKND